MIMPQQRTCTSTFVGSSHLAYTGPPHPLGSSLYATATLGRSGAEASISGASACSGTRSPSNQKLRPSAGSHRDSISCSCSFKPEFAPHTRTATAPPPPSRAGSSSSRRFRSIFCSGVAERYVTSSDAASSAAAYLTPTTAANPPPPNMARPSSPLSITRACPLPPAAPAVLELASMVRNTSVKSRKLRRVASGASSVTHTTAAPSTRRTPTSIVFAPASRLFCTISRTAVATKRLLPTPCPMSYAAGPRSELTAALAQNTPGSRASAQPSKIDRLTRIALTTS